MDSIIFSTRLNETRKNLTANPERSPLTMEPRSKTYGYASAGDRPVFADMDVGVRATQEQFAEFVRFPLVFAPFMQYAG